MTDRIVKLWPLLQVNPLFWITVTVGAYLAALRLQRWSRGAVLANPVLVAICLVAAVVSISGTPYATFSTGVGFINFLLGPATVALAVPLARNIRHVASSLKGVGFALAAGSLVSILSAVGFVWVLGGSHTVALSIAPRAATTPIAMAVSQQIGGVPSLTAALAIPGGVFSGMVGKRVMAVLRITDERAHGFAAGVAGGGIAAAEVAKRSGLAAAFAGLGIALNGLATAVATPFIAAFLR